MRSFEYSGKYISNLELMFAIPSVTIGVSILSLPRYIAKVNMGSDGWISIVISGLIVALFSWMAAIVAAQFPRQGFLTYASTLVTKPIAIFLTFCFMIISILVTAYEVRVLADISKQYLFDRTPIEVIALSFLLVVVYAVSSSRVGLFRLNTLFLPIILVITGVVVIFYFKWIELDNYLPVFTTNFKGYIKGIQTGISAYMGFGILLFYVSLIDQPKNTSKLTLVGIGIPIALYVIIFLTAIGVFGQVATSNLFYPLIELARRAVIPGQIFERIESVFFVIWTMAIFNTTAMVLDIATLTISSIFKKLKKIHTLFILSPTVFFLSMIPHNMIQIENVSKIMSFIILPFTMTVILLLFVISKIRRVKKK